MIVSTPLSDALSRGQCFMVYFQGATAAADTVHAFIKNTGDPAFYINRVMVSPEVEGEIYLEAGGSATAGAAPTVTNLNITSEITPDGTFLADPTDESGGSEIDRFFMDRKAPFYIDYGDGILLPKDAAFSVGFKGVASKKVFISIYFYYL